MIVLAIQHGLNTGYRLIVTLGLFSSLKRQLTSQILMLCVEPPRRSWDVEVNDKEWNAAGYRWVNQARFL